MSVVKECVHKKRRKNKTNVFYTSLCDFKLTKLRLAYFSPIRLCVPFFSFFSQRSKNVCNFLYFKFFSLRFNLKEINIVNFLKISF